MRRDGTRNDPGGSPWAPWRCSCTAMVMRLEIRGRLEDLGIIKTMGCGYQGQSIVTD